MAVEWQREHARSNSVKLAKFTKCTTVVLDALHGARVLSDEEHEELNLNQGDNYKRSSELYKIIVKRINGYLETLKALMLDGQNVPANILMEGYKLHDKKTYEELQEEFKKPEQVSTSGQNPSISQASLTLQAPLRERLSMCREKLQKLFPPEILDHILNKTPLNIKQLFERVLSLRKDEGTQIKQDGIYLPKDEPGLACILNIAQFDKNTDQRDDSLFDVNHLKEIFSFLNYEIFPPTKAKLEGRRKTKKDVLELIDKFVKKCEDESPASIVFFIGSHGRHPREIETSCGEYIPLMGEIVERFYANTSPKLKGIPKLFIVQACQGTALRKDENLTEDSNDYNILMLEATYPGGVAYSDPECGSFLVDCFIAAMFQHGRDKSIQEVLELAKEKLVVLRNEGIIPADQDPTITNRTIEKIYFNI